MEEKQLQGNILPIAKICRLRGKVDIDFLNAHRGCLIKGQTALYTSNRSKVHNCTIAKYITHVSDDLSHQEQVNLIQCILFKESII